MWVVGGWGVSYSIYTVHGLYWSRLSPLPLPPSTERELIYLALNGGWANLASWELFRVIIPPLFSLMEVLAPPSSFCPARSLGLHGETASSRGVGLSHHYCQHVCWSWRRCFAWLLVTRCRLTVLCTGLCWLVGRERKQSGNARKKALFV